jgi:hypothetical protein
VELRPGCHGCRILSVEVIIDSESSSRDPNTGKFGFNPSAAPPGGPVTSGRDRILLERLSVPGHREARAGGGHAGWHLTRNSGTVLIKLCAAAACQ